MSSGYRFIIRTVFMMVVFQEHRPEERFHSQTGSMWAFDTTDRVRESLGKFLLMVS